ncbi:MAG: hypothetical protein ACYDGY_09340, partial [Acidimicrobiales bacterium]
FAVRASAIATTRRGAQDAMPSNHDIIDIETELPLIFRHYRGSADRGSGEASQLSRQPGEGGYGNGS